MVVFCYGHLFTYWLIIFSLINLDCQNYWYIYIHLWRLWWKDENVLIHFGRELIGRHQLSWLPDGEAPPPYRGVLGVERRPSRLLHVQQSFPHLPTFGYRSVAFVVHMFICDRLPQNESEVATGEIEKSSRKGSFPDSRRFWDDLIFSIYILLTTRLALQGV